MAHCVSERGATRVYSKKQLLSGIFDVQGNCCTVKDVHSGLTKRCCGCVCVCALRRQLADAHAQLAHEAELRGKLEENMKQAFMRGASLIPVLHAFFDGRNQSVTVAGCTVHCSRKVGARRDVMQHTLHSSAYYHTCIHDFSGGCCLFIAILYSWVQR